MLALAFLVARLVLIATVRPFMDETYYWMWAQHPALSYFDHPPLIAWVQGLSGTIFGWTMLSLRLPVVLTGLADVGLLYLFARRDWGAAWRDGFWMSVLLFAATPVFILMTTISLPDHLMVTLLLAALYCLTGVIRARDEQRAYRRLLYLGAIALGLALLSKYYAALLGVGLLIWLLASRHRVLLRDPHVWLAMALVVAIQTPVIAWNVQHDFASFGFVTGGRKPLANPLSFSGTLGYLLGIVVMLSPFLVWPVWRFVTSRVASGMARGAFWVSTLTFFVASVFTNILVHWNLVAYVAALPFLAGFIRSRVVLVGHLAFGALIAIAIGVNYAVIPLIALFNPMGDQASSWGFGWDEVVPHVVAAKATHDVGFIAGLGYETASPLGYALRDRDVTSLAARTDAYDFWFDAEAHRGESALIVGDRWRSLGETTRAHFSTVELIDTVEIVRFGIVINELKLYYATAYAP